MGVFDLESILEVVQVTSSLESAGMGYTDDNGDEEVYLHKGVMDSYQALAEKFRNEFGYELVMNNGWREASMGKFPSTHHGKGLAFDINRNIVRKDGKRIDINSDIKKSLKESIMRSLSENALAEDMIDRLTGGITVADWIAVNGPQFGIVRQFDRDTITKSGYLEDGHFEFVPQGAIENSTMYEYEIGLPWNPLLHGTPIKQEGQYFDRDGDGYSFADYDENDSNFEGKTTADFFANDNAQQYLFIVRGLSRNSPGGGGGIIREFQ